MSEVTTEPDKYTKFHFLGHVSSLAPVLADRWVMVYRVLDWKWEYLGRVPTAQEIKACLMELAALVSKVKPTTSVSQNGLHIIRDGLGEYWDPASWRIQMEFWERLSTVEPKEKPDE